MHLPIYPSSTHHLSTHLSFLHLPTACAPVTPVFPPAGSFLPPSLRVLRGVCTPLSCRQCEWRVLKCLECSQDRLGCGHRFRDSPHLGQGVYVGRRAAVGKKDGSYGVAGGCERGLFLNPSSPHHVSAGGRSRDSVGWEQNFSV